MAITFATGVVFCSPECGLEVDGEPTAVRVLLCAWEGGADKPEDESESMILVVDMLMEVVDGGVLCVDGDVPVCIGGAVSVEVDVCISVDVCADGGPAIVGVMAVENVGCVSDISVALALVLSPFGDVPSEPPLVGQNGLNSVHSNVKKVCES